MLSIGWKVIVVLARAKILSIPHEGMLRYTTPAFAILVSFTEIVQLVFSQLSNIDVSMVCVGSVRATWRRRDPRHTFPEPHKVRRLHPQEIVRRMRCCQAARPSSKRHLSA